MEWASLIAQGRNSVGEDRYLQRYQPGIWISSPESSPFPPPSPFANGMAETQASTLAGDEAEAWPCLSDAPMGILETIFLSELDIRER